MTARETPILSSRVELGVLLTGCSDAVVGAVGGMAVVELCNVDCVEGLLGVEVEELDRLKEEGKPGISIVLGNTTVVATFTTELDCPERSTAANRYGSNTVIRFVEQHSSPPRP